MEKIILGLFFLILGILFANMLTNVCGCKDLIEGLCTTDNCAWSNACNFMTDGHGAVIRGNQDLINKYCSETPYTGYTYEGQIDANSLPILPDYWTDNNYNGSISWRNSMCCIDPVEESEEPEEPYPEQPTPPTPTQPVAVPTTPFTSGLQYRLGCVNGEIVGTII